MDEKMKIIFGTITEKGQVIPQAQLYCGIAHHVDI